MRANLRRAGDTTAEAPPIRAGELEIDLKQRLVTWAGTPVTLTRIEMGLLEMLVVNRGRLLTHHELLDGVWGSRPRNGGHDRLRVTVLHLRRKLHDDAARPELILTEPGLGYRWIGEHEEAELER